MCVCVCVCVCERERRRGREGEGWLGSGGTLGLGSILPVPSYAVSIVSSRRSLRQVKYTTQVLWWSQSALT